MMKKLIRKKHFNNLGQVWIETVIYTLIAFVMIGLVLGYARPKIQEIQDQALLKQSTEMLKQIDSTLLSMGSAGNQRILEISIKKGELKIDGELEKIIFEMESNTLYSEPGTEITDGSVIILTEEKADTNLVSLTLDYDDDYNLKIQGKDELRTLGAGSTPYKISILNEGTDSNGEPIMNITIS
jgi:type II secretory pathway pseudopilin PulG